MPDAVAVDERRRGLPAVGAGQPTHEVVDERFSIITTITWSMPDAAGAGRAEAAVATSVDTAADVTTAPEAATAPPAARKRLRVRGTATTVRGGVSEASQGAEHRVNTATVGSSG